MPLCALITIGIQKASTAPIVREWDGLFGTLRSDYG
jgi:hypothetical protein